MKTEINEKTFTCIAHETVRFLMLSNNCFSGLKVDSLGALASWRLNSP
jgi:hypothetical protein